MKSAPRRKPLARVSRRDTMVFALGFPQLILWRNLILCDACRKYVPITLAKNFHTTPHLTCLTNRATCTSRLTPFHEQSGH